MRRALALGFVFASACTFASVDALAQPAGANANLRPGTREATRRAQELFQEGSNAFTLGDYGTAAARFEEAYTLSARPLLLYNLGLTYDRLQIPQQAIDAYERFIVQLPNSPERPEVEARLRVLRTDADIERERATPRDPGLAPPVVTERVIVREVRAPAERPHTARTVGIVLGSLAVASAGVAAALYVFAQGFYESSRRDCGDLAHVVNPNAPWCTNFVVNDVQLRATLTNTMLFSSIALAVGSGVAIAVDLSQPNSAPASPVRADRRAMFALHPRVRSATVLPSSEGVTLLIGGTL